MIYTLQRRKGKSLLYYRKSNFLDKKLKNKVKECATNQQRNCEWSKQVFIFVNSFEDNQKLLSPEWIITEIVKRFGATARPRDTRPRGVRTLEIHGFELDPKTLEIHCFVQKALKIHSFF